MSASGETGNRDVVPRWRSVRRTIEAGEFQVLPQSRSLSDRHAAEINQAREAWERDRDSVSGLELIEAGLVAGDSGIALDSARQLTDERLRGAQGKLVSSLLGSSEPGEVEMPLALPNRAHARIAETKRALVRNPRSAILWGDLARRYTSLGQFDAAEQALLVARSLAPGSRYLLRSQVRFFVHLGEDDRAVHALRKSSRTLSDPWLLASLLSVSERAGADLPSKKKIRRVLEDDGFRPVERSELNSEAGTLEWRSGAGRSARSLVRAALADPTDNSLAQAGWLSNRDQSFEVSLDEFNVPFADEAFARAASEAGDWPSALQHAERWMDDQPFDAGAAVVGSYVASVGLDDFEAAALIAKAGLLASPTEPILRNNLAFALIQLGKFEDAARELDAISVDDAGQGPRAAVIATRGLLAFRLGQIERGYELYQTAIERARRSGERDAHAMALSMLVRELARAHETHGFESLVAELERAARDVRSSGVRRSILRAQQVVEHEEPT